MDELFLEHIINLSKRSKNRKNSGDIQFIAENPTCGDTLKLFIDIDNDGTISSAGFDGYACSLSTASADLFCEYITGKNIHDIQKILPNQLYEILTFKVPLMRSQCALLPLTAIHAKK